jgi:hypothetical protein
MLTTLIVCLANCGAPTTPADEIGKVAASFLEACHELNYLKRSYCPDIQPPVLLQCVNDIERELPHQFRADFRKGRRILEQRFITELPAQAEGRFALQLRTAGGDSTLACYNSANEISQRRIQLMRQLKIFGNNP